MSTRFTWLLGVLALVAIALLVACGTSYTNSSTNNGLVIVPNWGSQVVQAFGFSLNKGSVSTINTQPAVPGNAKAVVIDPTGTYAYVATNALPGVSATSDGVTSYKINSDGTLTLGSSVPITSPVALAMDSVGKFLYVVTGIAPQLDGPNPLGAPIAVFSIGSGGALSSVTAAAPTYTFPVTAQPPNFVAVAVTPTVFPKPNTNTNQSAACSLQTAPTTEYLYVADQTNGEVWEFGVDASTGLPTNPGATSAVQSFVTGANGAFGGEPSGVAVDACNRFVYVSNQLGNSVSGFTICNSGPASSPTCQALDGRLVPVATPYQTSNMPGPMVIDPFANYLYVLETGSNQITPFRMSQVSGTLTALTPVTTGAGPNGIAIRGDDTWVFVSNFTSATVSQYQVTPSTGALSPVGTGITTDNQPFGVAVK